MNATDADGKSALGYATEKGHTAIVELFKGIKTEPPRAKRYTPLEINQLIRSKSLPQKDLVQLLGEPDYRGKYKGQELWQYQSLTEADGKVWHQNFLFEGGGVSYDWVVDTPGPPKE